MPDWLSGIVGNVAESTLGNALLVLLKLMAGWTTGLLDFFSSWWLGLNPADVGPESGAFAAQQHTHGLISIIGVICTVIGLVRIARNRGAGQDTTHLAEGLIRVTVVSAAGLTGYQLLGQFSSAASPWLFRVISGEGPDYKFSSMMDLGSLTDQGLEAWAVGVVLILLPLVMLAGLIQAFLAMGTDLFGGILVALMPLTAAASVISGGKQAFNKQLSWVFSCGFFKPVAAVILGVGAFMAKGGGLISSAGADDTAGPAVHTFQTFICLIVGCFALPALLKLFAPVGSMMGSNAGSGFVAAAGGAAAGASFSNSSGVSSSSGTSNTVDSSSSSPSGAGDAGSTMESATSSVADTGKKAAGAAVTAGAAAATGGAAAGAGAAGAAGSGAGAGAGAAGSGAGSAAAGGEAATSAAGAAESSGAGAKTAAGQSGSDGGSSGAGAGSEGSSAAEGAEAATPQAGASEGSTGSDHGSSTGAEGAQSPDPGSGSTPPKAPDAGGPSGAAESDKSQSDQGSGWRSMAEKGVRGAGKSLEKTNETANEFIDPEGAEGQ
ncbi:hypothetical protein [uncultured Corynebacterium sp.]|uniref:hypothetical protein n=1 Tax=uncultured Corynebacterium sp. TaxID=159447 RepID=UPI0025FFBDB0|nr:hypothetical protein [uncultured Corynebacterium sp.]